MPEIGLDTVGAQENSNLGENIYRGRPFEMAACELLRAMVRVGMPIGPVLAPLAALAETRGEAP